LSITVLTGAGERVSLADGSWIEREACAPSTVARHLSALRGLSRELEQNQATRDDVDPSARSVKSAAARERRADRFGDPARCGRAARARRARRRARAPALA